MCGDLLQVLQVPSNPGILSQYLKQAEVHISSPTQSKEVGPGVEGLSVSRIENWTGLEKTGLDWIGMRCCVKAAGLAAGEDLQELPLGRSVH